MAPGPSITGTVTKLLGGASTVDAAEHGLFTCDLRGKLARQQNVRLAVGDRVELLPEGEAPAAPTGEPRRGVIEKVLERTSALRRPRDFKRDQVLCANVDRIVIVVAAFDPPYKRQFIDRLIVGCERDDLAPLLVVNKVDLCDAPYRELVEEDCAVYGALGYPSLLVSAETGEGLDALVDALKDGISAVVGPSGVGKSTLLNRVCPGLELPTGEVSEVDGRGRHTTTAAQLVRLPPLGGKSGFVIDTPGVRAFGLWDVGPDDLLRGFRDVADAAAGCRFNDCGHGNEPGCAVKAAVEAGDVDEERFASFRKLKEEIEAEAAARQLSRRR